MNNPNNKTEHSLVEKLRLLPLTITLSLTLLTAACSSTSHKKTALVNLTNAEETLLKSIEAERSTSSMKKRIERDQTLLEAEWHLREAIRAMFEANKAVKRAL